MTHVQVQQSTTRRVLVDGRYVAPVARSLEPLMDEVGGLAGEMRQLNGQYPLLEIWYGNSDVERHAAYEHAQAIHGLPGADEEVRESPGGRLYFWEKVRDALERDITTIKEAVASMVGVAVLV